ncbi:phosphoadenosine phosphosulfate reductase family protein [Marinobacter salarius]|uniref:phosphoadenosine phosphosulfate reductase domain-containing protein n=1 Tax=Marinobacter salarius TaxID=1420917 RepID=UPI003BACE2AE
MNLQEFIDRHALFVVSHSGGKDSQAMMIHLLRSGVPASQMVVIHACLGKVEWQGAKELARANAEAAGVPFIVATARRGLLQMVQERFENRPEVPSWPSSSTRQCTSDLKRGPIAREARRYAKARAFNLVVNCMGFRAEESPARAKRPVVAPVKSNTTKTREWFDFLPILDWTTQEVFQAIADDGQSSHPAYDARLVNGKWVTFGNDRLSCVFCIMGSARDMANGALYNPGLAREYIQMEAETGYTMHMSRKPLAQLIREGAKAEPLNFVEEAA